LVEERGFGGWSERGFVGSMERTKPSIGNSQSMIFITDSHYFINTSRHSFTLDFFCDSVRN
jgi:hypothetical protein